MVRIRHKNFRHGCIHPLYTKGGGIKLINLFIIIFFLAITSLLFGQKYCLDNLREGNVLIVNDVQTDINSLFTLQIAVENEEEFVSFQFDIIIPENVEYVIDSAILSDRAQDHILSISLITDNRIRILAFSLNSNPFIGNDGTILQLDFTQDLESGEYPINAENVILANSSAENILTSVVNGVLIINPIVSNNDEIMFSQIKNVSNYPNPFNPTTRIEFTLSKPSVANISILNIKGQKIKTFEKKTFHSGINKIYWNGKNDVNQQVSSGLYIYKISLQENTISGKMLLMK